MNFGKNNAAKCHKFSRPPHGRQMANESEILSFFSETSVKEVNDYDEASTTMPVY